MRTAYLAVFLSRVAGFRPSAHLSSLSNHQRRLETFIGISMAKSHREYTVIEDDDDIDIGSGVSIDDFQLPVASETHEEDSNEDYVEKIEAPTPQKNPEYGALTRGTVAHIQIGDMSLARKAWKKRRRSGSPLLVPCSLLSVDRLSMVRWNVVYLLEKFGSTTRDGIAITSSELSKHYRRHLRYPLLKLAGEVGFDTIDAMISSLFDAKVQESYGIRLVKDKLEDGTASVTLKAPISQTKARRRAMQAPILQFRKHRNGDHGDSDMITHTGYTRLRNDEPEGKPYYFLPLSAALRVSQKDDIDSGRIEEGGIYPAVVFDFDTIGDGGSPLLTLSLDPGETRASLKFKPEKKFEPIEKPKARLESMQIGDGPYRAKVVRLMRGKALVDIDAGRRVSSDGIVRVLGHLSFQDAVDIPSSGQNRKMDMYDKFNLSDNDYDDDDDDDEALDDIISGSIDELNFDSFATSSGDEEDSDEDSGEEEEEEDIAAELLSLRDPASFEEGTFEEGEAFEDLTHCFQQNEDGSFVYKDPETGEVSVVGSNDDDDDVEDSLDDEEEDEEELEEASDVHLSSEDGSVSDGDDDDDDTADDEPLVQSFQVNENGDLVFTDPDSGEESIISKDDDDYEIMMAVRETIEENLMNTPSKPPETPTQKIVSSASVDLPAYKKSKWLHVGDEVDVYIRSVSKQSKIFTVTTDPVAIKDKKQKDVKRENDAAKKLSRLEKQLGGSLAKLRELEGSECDGTVKALSKSGGWLYVQPSIQGLPVGIALDQSTEGSMVQVGDSVRVQISGIDEGRGQLALKLLP